MKKDYRLIKQENALRNWYPAKQMRTMVILNKKDDCITIETVKNDKAKHRSWRGSKSTDFWITNENMRKFFESGDIIVSNFSHFIKLHKYKSFVEVEIYWLSIDSYNGNVEGSREYFLLDYYEFSNWFDFSPTDEYRMLNSIEKPNSKLVLHNSENIKRVKANKLLRKKFGKKVMQLMNYRGDIVNLYDDDKNYSFYFTKFTNNQFDYNGGLIFHKDYDNPTNFTKAYYGIHT